MDSPLNLVYYLVSEALDDNGNRLALTVHGLTTNGEVAKDLIRTLSTAEQKGLDSTVRRTIGSADDAAWRAAMKYQRDRQVQAEEKVWNLFWIW